MTGNEVREKYLKFFEKRGHKIIKPAPLVLKDDPTTLFTSSGMQPLVPNLLGQPHVDGNRLVDSQPSFRTEDIEEVGDNRHDTFFEMLGNWSLGDYFKREQLNWIFEFLTSKDEGLGLDAKRLYVTVFEGNELVPKDTEAIEIWKEIFKKIDIDAKEGERVFPYPARKNWWSRAGAPDKMPAGEPGGPDSEVFFDFGAELKIHELSPFKNEKCHPNCDCGRYVEIANSVFVQYKKESDGTLSELKQKNVDFGGGLERIIAAVNDNPDIFTTTLFSRIIKAVEEFSGKKYEKDNMRPMQIITDHFKASTFLITDGVIPGNKLQGYVLRRLLRRALVKIYFLMGSIGGDQDFGEIIKAVFETYKGVYLDYKKDGELVERVIKEEIDKFIKNLASGIKKIEKIDLKGIDEKFAFDLMQSEGFPFEITQELAKEKGIEINKNKFDELLRKHQELSRNSSAKKFKIQ